MPYKIEIYYIHYRVLHLSEWIIFYVTLVSEGLNFVIMLRKICLSKSYLYLFN